MCQVVNTHSGLQDVLVNKGLFGDISQEKEGNCTRTDDRNWREGNAQVSYT